MPVCHRLAVLVQEQHGGMPPPAARVLTQQLLGMAQQASVHTFSLDSAGSFVWGLAKLDWDPDTATASSVATAAGSGAAGGGASAGGSSSGASGDAGGSGELKSFVASMVALVASGASQQRSPGTVPLGIGRV